MGCGTSRATPVASQGYDDRDNEFEYEQQRNPSPAAGKAGVVEAPVSTSKSYGGRPPPNATSRSSGDDNVAVALRSKRKGFVVEGTSVQVDSKYQRRVIPKDESIKNIILSALKDNMLFSGYGVDALRAMIDAMEPREVTSGDVIIQQGEPGDNFYAIESGKFEILVNGKKVADWGEGTKSRTVGELALLYNAPRAASVRAVTDAKLWFIDRGTFRELVANAAFAQHQKMKESLKKGLLEELSDEQLDRVASAANIVSFQKGEQIIKKGEEGEVFYIIDHGSVICKNLPGEQSNNILHAGDYFGERALLKKEPRAADVYAEDEVTLIALHREDFENLLGQVRALLVSNMGTRLLLCVPMLAQLNGDDRQTLFSRLKLVTFRDRTIILGQDTPVTSFMIINEGSVKVERKEGSMKGMRIASRLQMRDLTEETVGGGSAPSPRKEHFLSNGQWFGDGEIMDGVSSPATFSAVGNVQCFVLDAQTYRSVLSPISGKMKEALKGGSPSSPAPAPERASPEAKVDSSPVQRAVKQRQRLGIPLRELQAVRTLGTGTFGRVKLMYHKKTDRIFALKALQKAQIAAQNQKANIQAERDILFRIDHPFIIRLYDTYKDKDRLYMLMECVQGGELFSRLQNSPTPGRVPTGDARFYAACVLDAFEHVHSMSVIYRDLKPENLLIDSEGYLKIVDFGFAKVVKERTYTTCGTPEYLAPEVVLGRGHDKGVDYWALGILLYEQVAGYSPFADHDNNDQMVICRNILKGEVEFPAHFKDAALKDLILKLLVREIPKRLGCMRAGAGEIKAHKFFRDLEWPSLLAKRVPAPWRPKLANPLDTSHFDEYDEDDSCEAYRDDGTNWDKDF